MQVDKDALAISAKNTKKSSQVTLVELQKLRLEHQSLNSEKDNLQLSCGNLNEEKNKLERKFTELEIENDTTEEKEKQYQMQIASLEEQTNPLTASLKGAMEQKADIQPLKEHVLILRRRIHQIQI